MLDIVDRDCLARNKLRTTHIFELHLVHLFWKDDRYHKRSSTWFCLHLGSLISELSPPESLFESISGVPSCAQHVHSNIWMAAFVCVEK